MGPSLNVFEHPVSGELHSIFVAMVLEGTQSFRTVLSLSQRYAQCRVRRCCEAGDSVTALTWAANSKFRSELVSYADVVFVLLCVAKNVVVNEVTHILAERNKVADALSRRAEGISYEDVARQYLQLIRDMVLIDPKVEEILPWCDPRRKVETASEFRDFWSGVREAVAPHS
mmetsp:Transcript_20048/g.34092  ORF Transcript_20048/g.34092 Transcript_20048/m.34092 type:complete len:172 (-) Transcript_20048:957-1472(-)